MLIIRFSRVGKRNHAQYKVVVAEKSFPVKGKFIEQLGSYDPHLKVASLKGERINHWIENGAECSDSAYNLFVKEGIVKGDKRQIKIKIKKKEGEDGEKGEAVKEETKPATEETKAEVAEESKKEEPAKEEPKVEAPAEEKKEKEEEKVAEANNEEAKVEEVKEEEKK